MPRRYVIVSGFQVINNPRVVKEADAIAELGHEVIVLAAIHRAQDLPRIDAMVRDRRWQHIPVMDLTETGLVNRLRSTWLRAMARLMREAGQRFGYEHPMQLGYEAGSLLRTARRLNADLYSLHLEKALWVGTRLVNDGRAVRIDMEDWYTDDGLPVDQAKRPLNLMRRAESFLLNNAVHATTTSHALADALVRAYGCPKPGVIHNSFPSEERLTTDGRIVDRRDTGIPSITWFSQTIGPGRGLEALMQAIMLIDAPFELHLRGTPRAGFMQELLADVSPEVRNRVHVHPQVPQAELLSRLSEHDIGYCGELSDCASRHLTITNKVFEYMRAGLAIVASDTAGQSEVAGIAPEAVHIFPQGDARALAEALRPLIVDARERTTAAKASVAALEQHFSWELSKARLQRQVNDFLEAGNA
ncbi:MAG: glycosyltransferase [Minwuia sp.]|nr:glycosyltransferase [Minwuia sp.]